ncbi:carbohydrate sulfotransferase 1-like [Argopecten irradians]|uniref:carbohydrate sulfotransferase 1-like n=1 Tax=Argopecten irradians TaxID=31199 RepID=UPI0037145887
MELARDSLKAGMSVWNKLKVLPWLPKEDLVRKSASRDKNIQPEVYTTPKYIQSKKPVQEVVPQPLPEPPIENQGPTPIILMAYFRSGSSFVGDLIQAHDDVFYLFEPLRAPTTRFRLLNDTSHSSITRFQEKTRSILTKLSGCRLDHVPGEVIHDHFLNRSKKARNYIQCLDEHMDKNDPIEASKSTCLKTMIRSCLESKIVLVKVIRPSLAMLFEMMNAIPKLKIIHLMRDPRAMARARVSFGMIKKKTEIDDVTKFCDRLFEDAVVAENIKQKYPERILSLFYEEVAYHPIKEAQRIYKFADLEFSRRQQEIITAMTTNATPEKECRKMCTTKISTLQAEKWRKVASLKFVQFGRQFGSGHGDGRPG